MNLLRTIQKILVRRKIRRIIEDHLSGKKFKRFSQKRRHVRRNLSLFCYSFLKQSGTRVAKKEVRYVARQMLQA